MSSDHDSVSGPPAELRDAKGAPQTAQALWYVGGGKAALRQAVLPAVTKADALVEARVSGISRGTESLIFHGRVPPSEHHRMRAPFQEGDFPFPVKYGYAMVGLVRSGPDELRNRRVFCLHPHQDWFVLPSEALTPIPEHIPDHRAVLAANMETALNAIWDSGAGPADRIAVVGAGVVGCLTAHLASRLPGTSVFLIDVDARRKTVSEKLGLDFRHPGEALDLPPCDVVFHTSASEAGLATALALAGLEATVVEMSWYGDRPVAAPLGFGFHAGRLSLRSSQVGAISPTRRPRWSFERRREAALALLDDARLDCLLDASCRFTDAPEHLPVWLGPNARGLCHSLNYG